MVIDYQAQVNAFGASLPPLQKHTAREVFTELLENGYDYRWLYFAIVNLGQRDIVQYKSLFFYKPFREEVDYMVQSSIEQEEEEKKRRERICAAIAEQIELAKKQKPIIVYLKKKGRKKIDIAEHFAMIENMEE